VTADEFTRSPDNRYGASYCELDDHRRDAKETIAVVYQVAASRALYLVWLWR
jgi:hypothetical protein